MALEYALRSLRNKRKKRRGKKLIEVKKRQVETLEKLKK